MELNSPALHQFCDQVAKEPSLLMEGLWDAPKALLVHFLQEATGKNIVILTAESKMSKLLDDAAYFKISDIMEFPAWETLPGDEISPSPDIVGKRLLILHQLLKEKSPQVIVCPLQSALQKVPSSAFLEPLCRTLVKGDTVSFEELPLWLLKIGYRKSPVAADKGEFAVRGGILDVYPVGSPDPYRIEFFGDEIDNIRTFDPVGQKSTSKVPSVFISPAYEDALLKKDPEPGSLFSYLGPNTIVIFDNLLALEDHYVSFQALPGAASKFFFSFDALLSEIKDLQKIYWTQESMEELSDVKVGKKVGRDYYTGKNPLQPLSFEFFDQLLETKRWHHPFVPVQGYLPTLDRSPHLDIHFICTSESEEKAIQEKVKIPNYKFERGYLSSGFALADSNLILIPTTEFTHKQKVRREKWRNTYHTPPSDFHELVAGDLVVHFNHGIGKYLGIEKRPNHQGIETEFLILEYNDHSKLYVPVSQAYLVSRYIGTSEEIPTLHSLGTKNWQKTKANAQKAIIGYAQDLLRMSAQRIVQGGFTFPPDSHDMEEFEADFPYTETEDQLRAIADIKKDMTTSKAMDRLLCGDVGYGKTEVAMRAAFKAVAEGKKQVAVLVPTTVLCMQHFETFRDRMSNTPIIIKAVSRFQSLTEVKKILQELAEGKVDILIGTHRLLSKDVKFKDLGLIIIDEEQRFGVRSKEHLKALKAGVDCLTLTATPIPRTLYLSLVGAREISVINTPPQDRLPIKTMIVERDPVVVSNALLRELSRDGQVYFIHNRVESIYQVSDEIKKLIPQARVVTGHGQMNPDDIDTVFHTFKQGNADILVATTIIENGIDIPNANTILIDRADQFGLSDLYQLRGRVGRWNRPAYAYFLVPRLRELPEISRKRLYALIEAQGYGGGMKIAMRDLEIRGAGETLGQRQSGHVSSIGFHLYCKLLKKTVDALKKNQEPTFFETKMEFPYDARLPEEYIRENSLRLEIYHRLGETMTLEEVDTLFEELKDRFGKPPLPTLWLYHLSRIRTLAAQKRYISLKFNSLTLDTERQTPKGTEKKIFSLKPFKSPDELEKQVFLNLSHSS
ncbi:MAG TPA: transcription-repair coupling factor [Rhabdochlamydiaceae bacterium]|nr:transcription-repair coupling factor [Rhabdochlamydiaceae bacterium]